MKWGIKARWGDELGLAHIWPQFRKVVILLNQGYKDLALTFWNYFQPREKDRTGTGLRKSAPLYTFDTICGPNVRVR